jgi:(p)ppGpp synthase/HD superfamily hydrolase
MPEVAQTNLQLYNQLAGSGWSDPDIARIRDAYELACELFSGMVRPTGKQMVSHLVGTAGALAAVGERPVVVTAGLLHAAYDLGEFGDGTRGVKDPKRAAVAAAVGSEVEGLVTAYSRFSWGPGVAGELAASDRTFAGESRDLIVMRLANEVDEWTDAGLRYAPVTGRMQTVLDALVTLAARVGVPRLGTQLQELSRAIDGSEVPAVLVQSRRRTYEVAPRSHRPRLEVSARRLARRPEVVRARRATGKVLRRLGLRRPAADA